MSSSNESGVILAVCFVAVVLGALGISQFFDVPFSVGVKIVPYLVFLGIVTGGLWWYQALSWSWPLCLGGLWLSFLPVVDYKAGVRGDDFPLPMDFVAWYGHGIWQGVIFLVIVVAGYGFMKWRDSI
ncbi:hypothetical protein [Escherichia coli]|uniref:hypothetical protein n=1 Tax=Escherichia coli TaxID=562 RepID=UPI000BE445D1|nr:hypothetical protein [Escherichia coli]